MANLVSALFNHNTVIHDIYIICFVQYVKSVRDKDSCAIRQWSSEQTVIQNRFTHVRVDSRKWIVEKDNVGIWVSRSGERNSSLKTWRTFFKILMDGISHTLPCTFWPPWKTEKFKTFSDQM